jgi:hypothetical protein
MVAMPLSEEEHRILREIEAHLNKTDPDLVEQVSRTTVYRHALGSIRWAGLGCIVAFAVLLTSFATRPFLAFLGFLGMLAALIVVATNLKKIGRAGLHDLFGVRGGGLRGVVTGEAEKLRERFKRDR